MERGREIKMSELDATLGVLVGLSYFIFPFYLLLRMIHNFNKKGYYETKRYRYYREKKKESMKEANE